MYKLFFVVAFLILLTPLFIVQAEITAPAGTSNELKGTGAVPEPKTKTDSTVSLINPLGGTTGAPKGQTSIPILLGNIINSALGIIGSLALVMFIYGGATWMLSGGNQEKVTKGKQILIWATLGIIIIFTAYALVKFVLETITK